MKSITINGKTYYPGDEVELEIDGEKRSLPFPKDPVAKASGELTDEDLDAVTGGTIPCTSAFEHECIGRPGYPTICNVWHDYYGTLCYGTHTITCYGSTNGITVNTYEVCLGVNAGQGTASDARVKTDVRPLEGALDTLLALRGVTFAYDAPEALGTRPGEHVGFVAQEVEAVLPTWVHEAGGIKRLQAEGLSFEALAVEAIRELTNQNARLSADNDALRARLERLERLNER